MIVLPLVKLPQNQQARYVRKKSCNTLIGGALVFSFNC